MEYKCPHCLGPAIKYIGGLIRCNGDKHCEFMGGEDDFEHVSDTNQNISAAIEYANSLDWSKPEKVEITKEKLMSVLDENFNHGGIKITTYRYNKILTDLGFKLS